MDDAGNQNNVVEVGPAPTGAEFLTAKAGEIGAGVAAGAAGLAAAATTAAHHFTDNVNGTSESTQAVEAPQKTLTTEEKKNDPASGIRDAADGDIRSELPYLSLDAVETHQMLTLPDDSCRPNSYFCHRCFSRCSSCLGQCGSNSDGSRHSSWKSRIIARLTKGNQ